MRLFIIGNGFDLDHNVRSRFCDFKEYLEQTYLPTFNKNFPTFPNMGIEPDGCEVVDPNSASQILYYLINNISDNSDWRDFEKCLGLLNYQEILDLVEDDKENPFYFYQNLKDVTNGLKYSMLFSISMLFCEWVEQLDLSVARPKYAFLPSDIFLTFNYTPLLEKLYGVKAHNICHIHGSLEEGKCITGHGNDSREFDEYDEIISFDINQIHNSLFKKTEQLYYEHNDFFNRIYKSNITEIVFFGFSFSPIDAYYFEKIFKNIKTSNIKAYLSPYEADNDFNSKITAIRKLGFQGIYIGSLNKWDNPK